jgi:hypothetical protein
LGTEPDRGGASLATGEFAEVPDPLSDPPATTSARH